MIHLSEIELCPVVMMDPHTMIGKYYPNKKGGLSEQDRYFFWKEAMYKCGIGHLEPIQRGCDYVRLESLDESAIEVLIDKHYVEKKGFALPHSLDGGIALKSEGKIICKPQCCTSLEDYEQWFKIKQSPYFKRIWIGHPWLYYTTKGEHLLLSRLIEKDFDNKWRYYPLTKDNTLCSKEGFEIKDKKDLGDHQLRFVLDWKELKNAQAKLKNKLDFFKKELYEALYILDYQLPEQKAECLVDGNGTDITYDGPDPD